MRANKKFGVGGGVFNIGQDWLETACVMILSFVTLSNTDAPS